MSFKTGVDDSCVIGSSEEVTICGASLSSTMIEDGDEVSSSSRVFVVELFDTLKFEQFIPGPELLHSEALTVKCKSWFRWISFDYRVTLGFGSIAGGLDHVNPVIRLPLKHGIRRVLGKDDHSNPSVGTNPVTASITQYTKKAQVLFQRGGFGVAGIIGQTKDIYSDNIMDGINIDDLTIEQYLRLTQENQTPSMVKKINYDSDDMELVDEVGYITDGELVLSEHEEIDLAHTANTQSFEEELSSEEDLDEWLNVEMEKHTSKQKEKNKEDALIAIINSIREECRAVHKNKQIRVAEADLKKTSVTMEDTVNNDSFTSNFPSLEELNPEASFFPSQLIILTLMIWLI
ncbi:hypothetical protein Tco_1221019 [Tanacetum coccineum]